MFTAKIAKPALRPYLFITAFHLAGIIFLAFSGSTGLAVGAVAWLLGLRHAFDIDHIVAIDNSSRSIIARGKSAHAVGFHFSLGHSAVVFVATVALIVVLPVWGIGSAVLGSGDGAVQTTAAAIAAAVSGGFLVLVGILNLRVLLRIIRGLRLSGGPAADREQTVIRELPTPRAPLTGFLARRGLRLDRPHRLFLVGVLFGLGLDTAVSVIALVVAGTSSHPSAVIWLALGLPMLFLAGMSLGDTVNGQVMNRAYRWASNNRGRRAICNLAITGVSVIAAIGLGTMLLAEGGAAGLAVITVTGVIGVVVLAAVALGVLPVAGADRHPSHRNPFRRHLSRRLPARRFTVALAAILMGLTGCTALPTSVPSALTAPTPAATTSTAVPTSPAAHPSAAATAGVVRSSSLTLTSSAFVDGGSLPIEYTCDGAAHSPPLAWSGAPAGTVGYAVIMHHVPNDGVAHWYWVLFGMAASVNHLTANVTPPATVGTNSVNRDLAYAPPCSKGPGPKNYVFTVYALGAQPTIASGTAVSRDVLLAAITGHVLAKKTLTVTYSRTGVTP